MNGFDMMIKSMLGIDPTEFKAKLEDGFKVLKATLENFDKKLSNIEAQNARIIQLLEQENGPKRHGKFKLGIPGVNADDAANVAGQSGGAGEPTRIAASGSVNGSGTSEG